MSHASRKNNYTPDPIGKAGMASEVLICVLGLSRGQGHVFKSEEGVGKSCLCYRFLHPGFDDYISEHPSILALHEFESVAINNVHFLYWGSSKQTLPGRLGKSERTIDIHVVENTVLYQDVTSKPFSTGGNGRADNIDVYLKRVCGRLESPGKISYWTRDGISLPDTYRPQRYPLNAGSMKRGYVVVVDVSVSGTVFDAQLQRVRKICQHLKNHSYVLVAMKMEAVIPESLEKLHQMRKKLHVDLITTSSSYNYNITAVFRIIAQKVLKCLCEDIPTFEQAAGHNLAFQTSAKRSFRNFTTKWVHTSNECIEDIERTEQYRACKSAVGKYETDCIFAFKLLEVKNREMMVGVNDDPERRREFLEDFIETNQDMFLYSSQLRTKIEDYVAECNDQNSTSSDSPRMPRRVHHFPDNHSKPLSTTSSPSLKKALSTRTSSSSSSSPALDRGVSSDTHSLGSFESSGDEHLTDYVNMQQLTGGSTDAPLSQPHDVTSSQPHTITQVPTSPSSSEMLPVVIPPLEPCDGEDPGNQGAGEINGTSRKPSSSSTHELVTFPHTQPATTEATSGADDSAEEAIRDGPSDDRNVPSDDKSVPSGDGSRSTLSEDGPSIDDSNTTVYPDPSQKDEITASETVSASPPLPPRQPGNEDSADTQSPEKEERPSPAHVNEQQQQESQRKPKQKPPVACKPKLSRTQPPGSKVTASTRTPLSSPSQNRVPRSHTRPSSLSQKAAGVRLARSSLSSLEETQSPHSAAAALSDKSSVGDVVPSSGEEYFPTDDEGACTSVGQSEPSTPVGDCDIAPSPPVPVRSKNYHQVILPTDGSKSVIQEPPVGDCDIAPPPLVPVRSKNYHQVILPTDGSKSVIQELKEDDDNISPSRVSSAQAGTDSSPSPQHETKDTQDSKKSKEEKSKRKRFYDRWVLKKDRKATSKSGDGSPSGGSPVKHAYVHNKPKQKVAKKLKHSQSDRKAQHLKPSVHRVPSDLSRPMTPPCTRMLPRATFLNMSTRPLPQPPFVLRHDDYEEHDADEYDVVDTFNPAHSLPPGGIWAQDSPTFSNSQPAPLQKSGFNLDTMDYVNDDQCPRPALSAGGSPSMSPQLRPPAPGFPFTSSSLPRPRVSSEYPSTRPVHNPMTSLPPRFSTHHTPTEPAHCLSIPHPLPSSAKQSPPNVPEHLPLVRMSSSPSNPTALQSPDYDYPKIAGLGLFQALPSRYPNSSHPPPTFVALSPTGGGGRPIVKSRSTDFEHDQYVEMKMVVPEPNIAQNDDDNYQNSEVIELIRAKRSHSMEDLHLYKNISMSGPPQSIMNQPTSIPLPARTTQTPQFVIPPRNLPRQQASEMSPPATAPFLPAKGLTNSSPHSQVTDATTASNLPPHLSPRPVPKPRFNKSLPKTPDFSPQTSPRHTTHPPHEQVQQLPPMHAHSVQQSRESLPNPAHPPKLSRPDATVKPRTPPSVGTATWSEEDDPMSQYYNVVSKSFFSLPKPTNLSENTSYLDILPE